MACADAHARSPAVLAETAHFGVIPEDAEFSENRRIHADAEGNAGKKAEIHRLHADVARTAVEVAAVQESHLAAESIVEPSASEKLCRRCAVIAIGASRTARLEARAPDRATHVPSGPEVLLIRHAQTAIARRAALREHGRRERHRNPGGGYC